MNEKSFEQPKPPEAKVEEEKSTPEGAEAEKDHAKYPLLKDADNAELLDWLYQYNRDLDPKNTWVRPEMLARLKDNQASVLRELRRRIERGAVANIPAEAVTELIRAYPEFLGAEAKNTDDKK